MINPKIEIIQNLNYQKNTQRKIRETFNKDDSKELVEQLNDKKKLIPEFYNNFDISIESLKNEKKNKKKKKKNKKNFKKKK